jgi:hypothetical protein
MQLDTPPPPPQPIIIIMTGYKSFLDSAAVAEVLHKQLALKYSVLNVL